MTLRRRILLSLLGLLLLGGLFPAVPAARAAPSEQSSTVHIVKWGETLFSIARRYGTSVEAICAANGIADPTRIYAGQRLLIPTTGAAPAASSAPTGAVHVVRRGENLYRIALRYGVTVQALAELNGIYNPGHIVSGQKLLIPGSATTPALAYQPQHASTTHVVRRGETLSAIAQRYGIPLWVLVQANNVANPALIIPGQTLTVPRPGSLAASTPAAGGGGKRILIDLSEQHLYAYQGNVLIYSFVVSTGKPGAGTSTGTFRVLDKYPNAYASTWNLQMPHWLGIYWAGGLENGIHALPILSNGQRLWAGYLGTPVSFGCIILGVEEARLLYTWAEIGTPVTIQY